MRDFFRPTEAPYWLAGVLASIREALGDIWPRPLLLKDYSTAALPDPGAFRQGLAYDSDENDIAFSDGATWRYLFSGAEPTIYESHLIELGDDTSVLTGGTAKKVLRWPYKFVLEHPEGGLGVRASLAAASSSGAVAVDINQDGTSILATALSIDESETTSVTAGTPAVLANAVLEDDAQLSFDVDAAGAGARGLKLWLIGYRLGSDDFGIVLEGDMNITANDLEMLEVDMTGGIDLLLQEAA